MKNLSARIVTVIALLPVVLFAFLRGGYFLLTLLWLVGLFCAV